MLVAPAGSPLWWEEVERHRLAPLLVALARDGLDLVPEASGAQLAELAAQRRWWSMLVERTAVRVAGALDGAGVPFLVLKGLATAHLDHPEPGQREVGDVDVMVAPADVHRADAALAEIARPAEVVSESFRLRNKARGFVTEDLVEIDLHHRLIEDPFGRAIAWDDLWGSRQELLLAGTPAFALGPGHRLAHAVTHWMAGPGPSRRASGLADIVLLATQPDVVRAARQILARWSLGFAVHELPPSARLLGAPPRPASSTLARLFLAAHRGSRLAAEVAAVVATPTTGAKLGELATRFRPADELMALHGVSRPYRLARFAGRVVTGRARSDR